MKGKEKYCWSGLVKVINNFSFSGLTLQPPATLNKDKKRIVVAVS
jgi:hypothetical protein